MVAGRDALRQALLAMVPQIDELQRKREIMKAQAREVGGQSAVWKIIIKLESALP